MAELVITNRARSDLAEIASYIAQDSPIQATNFIRKFIETVEDVCLWPEANPLLDDRRLREAGLRRAVIQKFRNHLFVYRYKADELRVLRVYHAAQDWQRYVFDV